MRTCHCTFTYFQKAAFAHVANLASRCYVGKIQNNSKTLSLTSQFLIVSAYCTNTHQKAAFARVSSFSRKIQNKSVVNNSVSQLNTAYYFKKNRKGSLGTCREAVKIQNKVHTIVVDNSVSNLKSAY